MQGGEKRGNDRDVKKKERKVNAAFKTYPEERKKGNL